MVAKGSTPAASSVRVAAMSRVTELVVIVNPTDQSAVQELSFWLTEDNANQDDRGSGGTGNLLPLTENWGGYKNPSSELWAGALNYIDVAALLTHMTEINWTEPDQVQILVQEEEDDYFRLYMIRNGALRLFTPPSADAGR
jgi:hypothetical protein